MQFSNSTRLIFVLCAIAWVVIVARTWINVKGTDALQPTLSQSQVQAFAKEQLDELQRPSFSQSRELCGIIFETSERELGASIPRDGDEATCDIVYFDEPGMVPVASFHTHGQASKEYDGEVPSITDIQSDMASGTDGYVATPGGRFWHIDHSTGIARMVCGEACLTQDPDYRPCPADKIAPTYTIESLAERFRAMPTAC